jgi:UDP-2-acetamido-2,6-beta-L-arabino-hexul-4-ose reductase
VKTRHGGQAFLSTTHPGITRGRHYHRHKVERFLVVDGEAEIRIRRLFDEEVKVFRVSGVEPCYVDMPTFHTHEITNVGDRDLLTLFWSHEVFDPAHPDTYPEPVILNP